MTKKILLIGAGNMGFAMLKGWMSFEDPPQVTVVDPSQEYQTRATQVGARAFAEPLDLDAAQIFDLIVVAVKPHYVTDILGAYKKWISAKTTVVSVAAGVTINRMAQALPNETAIIRCMPNTPAAIGQGMMVLCSNTHVQPDAAKLAEKLFATSGKVAWVADETLMDAVTAISGSGPAYVFHFVECLTQAGIDLGLPEETAAILAKQTVSGAGQMVAAASETPTQLRQNVTSPNGTTQAALEVLMQGRAFEKLLGQAARAARDRGVELDQES
ncbi:MAG: pyrroline-5-carboxylate reductase [Pseudomonadota bacterium]